MCDCSINIVTHFIFEYIITWFGCPKSLNNDQLMHFISTIITTLTMELPILHNKSSLYHPEANDTIEAFNKILETRLTQVCSTNKEDWDERVLAVLWAY